MSDKISPHHLQRKAILYIRQSSSYQVMHNEESRRLQYAMRDRLGLLGWEDIEVVDEDLGQSAAGTVTRLGFERMVAEVCRIVDTLLIDQDVVYAPRLSNDRLLLGLKGSLNEYELDLLRQRSWAE